MAAEIINDHLRKPEDKGLADPNIVASTSHGGQVIFLNSAPKPSTSSPEPQGALQRKTLLQVHKENLEKEREAIHDPLPEIKYEERLRKPIRRENIHVGPC
jgi:hypothetical protein